MIRSDQTLLHFLHFYVVLYLHRRISIDTVLCAPRCLTPEPAGNVNLPKINPPLTHTRYNTHRLTRRTVARSPHWGSMPPAELSSAAVNYDLDHAFKIHDPRAHLTPRLHLPRRPPINCIDPRLWKPPPFCRSGPMEPIRWITIDTLNLWPPTLPSGLDRRR